MSKHVNVKRLAGVVALMTTAGGLSSCVLTDPTAVLQNGTVTVTGTQGDDHISLSIDDDQLQIDFDTDGSVDAEFPRSQFNQVRVDAEDGNDGVAVTGAGKVPLTISGGAGDDRISSIENFSFQSSSGDAPSTVSGDDGNDNIFVATPADVTVLGGAGDDVVEGDGGLDQSGGRTGRQRIALGDGNDRFISEVSSASGARSDVVFGGAGQDTLEARGTFADENVVLSASADHLILEHQLRDRIDSAEVENVRWVGLGGLDGGDGVTVGDLSGTGVVNFTPDFSAPTDPNVANNSTDVLTVSGTDKIDHITVSGSGRNTTVSGLVPTVTPVFLHQNDVLNIVTLAGDDIVDSSGLQPGLVQLNVT